MRFVYTRFALALFVSTFAAVAMAQRADVAIETDRERTLSKESQAELIKLRDAGTLMSFDRVKQSFREPAPMAIELPPPSRELLTTAKIAARARAAMLRVGWCYQCHKCKDWHMNLAGGYVIAAGGIGVTCEHVVDPSNDMKEGYLIALDAQGQLYAVTRILAIDPKMDVAIFQFNGALPPLPLNDQIGPGDAAFLLSDPKGHMGYFSAGMVNRFYWLDANRGDPNRLDDARRLRVNVSTDWAPGSSGAAVLDDCGNAICHVSRIETEVAQLRTAPRVDPPAANPATKPSRPAKTALVGTQIVFHEGVPVRGIKLLVDRMNSIATKPTTKPARE